MYIHLVILFVNLLLVDHLIHKYLGAHRRVSSHSIMVVVATSSKVFPSPLWYDFIFASSTINRTASIDVFVSYLYPIVSIV